MWETYFVEHDRYPAASDAEEIAVTPEKENSGTRLPRLDAWGQPFIIEVLLDGGHYFIISMGWNGLRETQEPYSELPRVNPEPGRTSFCRWRVCVPLGGSEALTQVLLQQAQRVFPK